MYAKGQEAERQQHADQVINLARQSPSRVSVPELMQQLQVTQEELENIRVCFVFSFLGSFVGTQSPQSVRS